MEHFNRKKHWEQLYETTDTTTKSWYQPVPLTSLSFIEKSNLPLSAKIIDVGAGDSHLVDHLLTKGYQNITVVDISAAAIEKARKRLGDQADKVRWIVSDIIDFSPEEKYDLWHDRAAFHFLTEPEDVDQYLNTVRNYINEQGKLIIGTFSEKGPEKCSGLYIRQYSDLSLTALFFPYFDVVSCEYVDHQTPSGGLQNFVFCQFIKK